MVICFFKLKNTNLGRLIFFTEKIWKIEEFRIGISQRDSIEKNKDFKLRIW